MMMRRLTKYVGCVVSYQRLFLVRMPGHFITMLIVLLQGMVGRMFVVC